ncbi:MAG: nicotinate (nicotinamide) nucleotide adenylyltransferase [Opitutales bacterium TMED158]|nr:MAG: nicotinate (nicotinamide) nucleotide adenylyltransferase [Opitutales bacterium TMED158]
MAGQRIGILGGSFDPIHIGHLIVANDALEQLELDRVLFIPAAAAPLKPKAHHATAEDRLAMTQLAIATDDRFEARDLEIARGGESFSIDTARAIASEFPDAALFWIIGGDQAEQLAKWHRIEALSETVAFICFDRGQRFERSTSLPDSIATHALKPRRIDVSSTEIRERLKSGHGAKYFLPDGVLSYIKARNLYTERGSA